MAKPQLENGHTRIANELMDALSRLHLSANQWQVLIFIIRKTYGYNRKVDHIANSQIVAGTGLCKAVVSRALANLKDMSIISRNGKSLGLQKDWEKWLPHGAKTVSNPANTWELAEQQTPDSKLAEQQTEEKLAISTQKLAKTTSRLAEQQTKVSSCAVTQKKKETITKESIQKKVYGEFENVFLSDYELEKLIKKFGRADAYIWIEKLSAWMKGNAKKKADHYATILNWSRREEGRKDERGTSRKLVKQYTPEGDL